MRGGRFKDKYLFLTKSGWSYTGAEISSLKILWKMTVTRFYSTKKRKKAWIRFRQKIAAIYNCSKICSNKFIHLENFQQGTKTVDISLLKMFYFQTRFNGSFLILFVTRLKISKFSAFLKLSSAMVQVEIESLVSPRILASCEEKCE